MKGKLFAALVKRGIIQIETEVEAKYLGLGLSGDKTCHTQDFFLIQECLSSKNGEVNKLRLSRKRDGWVTTLTPDDIIFIDGMTPEVLADVYDIKADGGKKEVKLDEFGNPVRRGRKPKHILKQIEEANGLKERQQQIQAQQSHQ